MPRTERTAHLACLLLLAAFAIGGSPRLWAQAPAQAIVPASAARPIYEVSLTVGEAYSVTAQRAQAYMRYDGKLIAASQDWLVLRCVREKRREAASDDIGMIPYVQHWLERRPPGRITGDIWIPRGAVSKCERSARATSITTSSGVIQAAARPTTLPAAPQLGVECSIELADVREIVTRQGKLAKLSGGNLTLACQHTELRERPLDGSSRIPILNAFQSHQEPVRKTTLESHPLDKVLAICFSAELPDAAQ